MKLLQICNVANICGGTFGCVYSIAKCLPDWDHEAIATNSGEGPVIGETQDLFPGKITRKRPPLPNALIESIKPDAIIFHNTAEHCVPPRPPVGVPRFFYQHSAAAACKGARRRCDVFWCVSEYLANAVGIDKEQVLYQPVPCPPNPEKYNRIRIAELSSEVLIVGSICTANPRKWKESVEIHDFLHREHPEIQWAFVGCPEGVVTDMILACGGKASFHDTSYGARNMMHFWDAMLHHSTSVTETYGRTVCEAQRTGCIPLVTDRGGFREQIINGQDGFLCKDHEEFSLSLRLLKQHDRRKQMSEAAIRSADSRGSLKAWRETFLNWFRASLED